MQKLLRALALTMTVLASLTAGAEPKIEPVPGGLRASGITAGGDAVWFGETIDTFALTRRLTRHVAIAHDEDRDGVVTFDLPSISPFFLIVAVDATTGEYGTYHGSAGPPREFDLLGNNWRSGLENFDLNADFLEILLVRPEGGAWTMRAAEGGHRDGDRAMNGRFRLVVNDMQPLTEGLQKPGGVRPRDVLVLIDPQTLDLAIRPAKE